MIIAYVTVIAMLVGLAIVLATTEASHPKLNRIGWILFAAGTLSTLLASTGHVVTIGK